MAKYVVIPTDYPWSEVSSLDQAVEIARERIAKNQRCFAGARVNKVYAICKVEAYVRPVRPVVDIEVVRWDEADAES